MWVEIKNIEDSKFDNNTKLIFFDYFDELDRYVIFSQPVKHYVKCEVLNIGDEIFVIKTYSKDNKERFILKSVRKKE